MRYEVVLIKSDEGYAIHCPALPACWSQGRTQDEALANIRDAISVYLDYVSEEAAVRLEVSGDGGVGDADGVVKHFI